MKFTIAFSVAVLASAVTAVTTTTTKSTTTTTAAATCTPRPVYAQCGGVNYSVAGCTKVDGKYQCANGGTCTYINDYYYQCYPAAG
ncbi:hypothetical protein TWF481_001205 [Arthrobotrys musiformis]|uniref:CBM1 domain-containing protein n=1 Tax=Arthrobotrys musiformis TaxID=47236 RepID=A0AAV9WPV4_9PEZI